MPVMGLTPPEEGDHRPAIGGPCVGVANVGREALKEMAPSLSARLRQNGRQFDMASISPRTLVVAVEGAPLRSRAWQVHRIVSRKRPTYTG
jgi:hypothetical protein